MKVKRGWSSDLTGLKWPKSLQLPSRLYLERPCEGQQMTPLQGEGQARNRWKWCLIQGLWSPELREDRFLLFTPLREQEQTQLSYECDWHGTKRSSHGSVICHCEAQFWQARQCNGKSKCAKPQKHMWVYTHIHHTHTYTEHTCDKYAKLPTHVQAMLHVMRSKASYLPIPCISLVCW